MGFIFIPFLLGGIALIAYSRRISDGMIAANRAAAAEWEMPWMEDVLGRPWVQSANRASTVAVGVVWILVATVALVATVF